MGQICKKNMRYCYKYRTRCCKKCFQKVVHKRAEATDELMGNKITKRILKSKSMLDVNSRNIEEILISPEKKQGESNK